MGTCFSNGQQKVQATFKVSELQKVQNNTIWGFEGYASSETTIAGLHYFSYDNRDGTFLSILHHQPKKVDQRICVCIEQLGFRPTGIEVTIEEGRLIVHFMDGETRVGNPVVWDIDEYVIDSSSSIEKLAKKKRSANAEPVDMTSALRSGLAKSYRNVDMDPISSSEAGVIADDIASVLTIRMEDLCTSTSTVHQMGSSSSSGFPLLENASSMMEIIVALWQMNGDATFNRNVEMLSKRFEQFDLVIDASRRILVHVSRVHSTANAFVRKKTVSTVDLYIIEIAKAILELSQLFLTILSSTDFSVDFLSQVYDELIENFTHFQNFTTEVIDAILDAEFFSGLSTSEEREYRKLYHVFTSMIMDFQSLVSDYVTANELCVLPSGTMLVEADQLSLFVEEDAVFTVEFTFKISNEIMRKLNHVAVRGLEMKQVFDLFMQQTSNQTEMSSRTLMLDNGVPQELLEQDSPLLNCDDIKQGEPFSAQSLNIIHRQTIMEQLRGEMKSLKKKMDEERIDKVKASMKVKFGQLLEQWKELVN